MKTYNVAPMDAMARAGTVLVFAMTVACIVAGILKAEVRPLIAAAALLLVLTWMSWQVAPKRYDLTDDALVIIRAWPFRNISIPAQDIREVKRVEFSPWTAMGTLYVGGLFSYSGRLWNKQLGGFYSGITDFKRTVLIVANGKFVISPERPDEFIGDIDVMI